MEKLLNKKYMNEKYIEFFKSFWAQIFQFIFSVFLAYNCYAIVVWKVGNNIWSLKNLILFGIFFIINLFLMIGVIKYNKNRIEKIVISFLIPVNMLYVFFMPPTYVPDEPAHSWRAYEVSNGILYLKIDENGEAKTEIPKDLREVSYTGLPNLKEYYNYLHSKKTAYNDTIKVDSPTRGSPFFLYIISSIGFVISRMFNLNILYGIYMGRIFNLAFSLAVLYYCIRKIPFGKSCVIVLAFFPMVMQQAASFSYDCIVNAVSILFITKTLQYAFQETKISKKQWIFYCIISVALACAKYAYAPMLLLSLLLLRNNNNNKKKTLLFIVFNAISVAVITLIFLKIGSIYPAFSNNYLKENDISSSRQIEKIINEPSHVIKCLLHTILYDKFYIAGTIGSPLAWLNVGIFPIIIDLFVIFAILSPFIGENKYELNKKEKLIFIITYFIIYLEVNLALYITWTPVGNDIILGMQGRYFIPIFILPVLCLINMKNILKNKTFNIIIPICLGFLSILAISEVLAFYI